MDALIACEGSEMSAEVRLSRRVASVNELDFRDRFLSTVRLDRRHRT